MKYILLLLISLPCFAQKVEIPKGSPGLTVTVIPSDTTLFDKTVEFLNANDYVVDKADRKSGMIVTQSKAAKGTLANVRILATVKNNMAVFKEQWSGAALGYSFTNEPVSYKGSDKKLFLILNSLILKFRDSINQSTLGYLPSSN